MSEKVKYHNNNHNHNNQIDVDGGQIDVTGQQIDADATELPPLLCYLCKVDLSHIRGQQVNIERHEMKCKRLQEQNHAAKYTISPHKSLLSTNSNEEG